MGSITLDTATIERLTALDPSLAGLASAMRACSPNGPWSLHDVRWTPGHGCRLAYVERAKDSEPTFVAVEVSGEEWGRYAWRDDTALPALITATDSDEVARRLETVLGEPVRCSITPVRYRPGLRCVLRYDVEGPSGRSTFFAKALPSDSYARVAELHAELAARDDDSGLVPEIAAWWPDLHVVVGRSIDGRTASSLLGTPSVPLDDKVRLGHDIGDLLARFHELPVTPDATWSADQQVITTADAMGAVECADPARAIRLGSVLDALAATLPEPGRPVLGHGSFRAGQVVVTPGGRPVLLDVDEVRLSDRERDLGMALAHLDWQGIRTPHLQQELTRTEHALLAAYEATAGEVRPDALRWWRAAGLVQVAVRRFRRLEVGAWSMTDALVDAAEHLLADGSLPTVVAEDLLDVSQASLVLGRAAAREVEVDSAELLGVAPGRRGVVRYMVRGVDGPNDESGAVPVIGKQFSHARSARLSYYHLRLLSDGPFGDGPLRVPSPVGIAGAHRLLFYRGATGDPLDSMLDGPAGTDGVRSAALWLAQLHSSDLQLPRDLSLVGEVESTRQWATHIGQAHPAAATRANVLASRWAAAAKSASVDAAVPIHKDFHAGHVFIGQHTCAIDLDEARMGDPAFDVAHFTTYLDLLGAPDSAVEEFMDTYSTATGWADKGTLAPFRAYTCLKIAKQALAGSGPFRSTPAEQRVGIADAALLRGTSWVDTPWQDWS